MELVFDTKENLKEYNTGKVRNGQIATVLGDDAEGDTTAYQVQYDIDSSASADDSEVFAPDDGNGRWNRVGAVGNANMEKINDLGSVSGAIEIDLSDGTVVQATLTGATTLSFAGLPSSGRVLSFTLEFSGAEDITYPDGAEFVDGIEPSIVGPDYELPCSIDSEGTLTVYGVVDEIA